MNNKNDIYHMTVKDCIIFLLFVIIVFFCLSIPSFYFKENISPFDPTFIAKCPDCENLVIQKYTRNISGFCFCNCEYLLKKNYLILSPKDSNYELFKLKYNFYKLNGKNFKEFYSWYLKNKDKEFYKWVKKIKIMKDIPLYKTQQGYYNSRFGKSYKQKLKYDILIGYKQIEEIQLDIKYENPNNKEYEQKKCSIIEWYINRNNK